MNRKAYILKILTGGLWICAGAGLVLLLVSAMHIKEQKNCKGLEINIAGVSNNFFIDKKDVERIVFRMAGKNLEGKSLKNFRLKEIENSLKKDIWIKSVEIYFDNNDVLKVDVLEREPVARIFTSTQHSFYIDSSLAILPLSDRFSARVPLFTGFPTDALVLNKKDSSLLKGIMHLSLLLQEDPFLSALVEQVDINESRHFIIMPKVGNQLIDFGDARQAQKKFEKLKLFYSQVITKSGWNYYSHIDLQFNDQVVARIRGREEIKQDSLRTMQLMHMLAARAAREAADSLIRFTQDNERNTTDSSMINSSREREEH